MLSITVIPNTVDVPQNFGSTPSIDKHASPDIHFMSITTSATSFSNLPEECREVTLSVKSRDVRATTCIPIFLASLAISITPAFLPETDMIIIVSSPDTFSRLRY